MSTEQLLVRRANAVAKGVSDLGFFADKAKGAVITDVDGKEYIDFAGGIGVVNVGHNHPKVVAAIKAQADKLLHTCFHVAMYESYVELCERLTQITPGNFEKRAVLVNSGAEAVENAVKIARLATGRPGVLAMENGFHGRTLLTMTLTSKVKPYKFHFGPFAPEVYRMPYAYCYRCPLERRYPSCGIACAEKMRDMFINHVAAENIACLLIEPIAGEGGFLTPPPEYFPRLREICSEFGIVMIVDEVQAGMGRTGKMFAIEHWGVEPDLITTAKSLGGGLPISAVVGREEIMNAPHPGGLGGTYGGNPVSCAAALAVLDIFEQDGMLQKSQELGETLLARFKALQERYPVIGDVRGKGPMLALELVETREGKEPATAKTKALAKFCLENGLILLTCGNYGNVIRTLMPLVITEEQLERGLAILEEGFKTIS